MAFKVKFWGVRGSIACPTPRHIGFGGNTSCIEVSAGGERIILDAGTGIRNLGFWMLKKDVQHASILLSHTHWDHINGFPFFTPAFIPGKSFNIMAGHVDEEQGGIRKVLGGQMAQPFFPVPLEAMQSEMNFQDFKAGEEFSLGPNLHVKTAPLNHPNGSTAYRIEHRGKSVCYVTDTEHIPGKPDENILGLIEGSDLVIYDSTYTEEEFPAKVGWGHSTWEEGVKLCQMANVKMMAIFHHDPEHDDVFMEKLEIEARERWSGAIVARENMRINLL
jgi:phosphoribosyl 1,2-cyclic phosphodiesterase